MLLQRIVIHRRPTSPARFALPQMGKTEGVMQFVFQYNQTQCDNFTFPLMDDEAVPKIKTVCHCPQRVVFQFSNRVFNFGQRNMNLTRFNNPVPFLNVLTLSFGEIKIQFKLLKNTQTGRQVWQQVPDFTVTSNQIDSSCLNRMTNQCKFYSFLGPLI